MSARRAAACLVLLAVVAGCKGAAPHPEHAAEDSHEAEGHAEGIVELSAEMLARVTIRTAPVDTHTFRPQLETTGQVDFEQGRLAHVTPRVPGRVVRVDADLGQAVRKGQALAIIDSIDLGQARSTLLQARVQEDLARQNLEREERLFAERISSEREALEAKAAHAESLARLKAAEETLHLYGVDAGQEEPKEGSASLLPVRSPLAGKVIEKHLTVGELVAPERNMFTIADLGHVWIWIDVYEKDIKGVHLKDDVEVVVDSFPGERFVGEVSYISDQVDADTRTVRARIDVQNPETKLRPGMFARVRVSDPHEQPGAFEKPAVVVPESAVYRDGEGWVVFVPHDANHFERREVVVGRKSGGLVEVVAGLVASESVVVEGTFLLKSELSKGEMGGGHEH